MASGWAYFRKQWIKPEVYPLIGSMAAALGLCGAAMINKIRDPTVGWNKSKRRSDLYQDVEEVVPMWSSAKHNSTSIFGSDRNIMESNKLSATLPNPITIKIGDAEEEEEEEETPVAEEQSATVEEEAPAAEPQSAEAVAAEALKTAVDVIDEAAETINAAIDAAVESRASAVKSDAPEQTASSITEHAPPAQSVQPTAAES